MALRLSSQVAFEASRLLGLPPMMPTGLPADFLLGGRPLLADLLVGPLEAVTLPIMILFFLLLLRVVLRRQWIAATVFVLSLALLNALSWPRLTRPT